MRLTHDAALGLAINQQLYATHTRHDSLAVLLNLSKSTISRKLRGLVPWTAAEISIIADFFGLSGGDLMPSRGPDGEWVPAPFKPGYAKAPTAGAGALSEPPERIELSTYSLRVNRSAD